MNQTTEHTGRVTERKARLKARLQDERRIRQQQEREMREEARQYTTRVRL